jgi:hypothetical protein
LATDTSSKSCPTINRKDNAVSQRVFAAQPEPINVASLPNAVNPTAITVTTTTPANGLGTAGLVLGIVGAALSLVPVLGFILGVLATTFGGIGVAKANRGEATNRGMAIAGLVLGIITMAAWPVLIAIAAASAAAAV